MSERNFYIIGIILGVIIGAILMVAIIGWMEYIGIICQPCCQDFLTGRGLTLTTTTAPQDAVHITHKSSGLEIGYIICANSTTTTMAAPHNISLINISLIEYAIWISDSCGSDGYTEVQKPINITYDNEHMVPYGIFPYRIGSELPGMRTKTLGSLFLGIH
jgi:hypothetical protein